MKNNVTKRIIKIILSIVAIFIAYWFVLPPLNFRSTQMWNFLITCVIICVAINFFSDIILAIKGISPDKQTYHKTGFSLKNFSKPAKVCLYIVIGVVAVNLLGSLIGAQLFNAKGYHNLIEMKEGDFAADVSEINKEQIPIVDRDTASRLGQRKLGEMADLVSQFEIMDLYTQINYNGRPVRVTPLQYGDIIKWFNNQSEGIPAYITVDMTTQETALVRLDKGIKYSPSEYLLRDLNRHLRFSYPTLIFDEVSFEIDDDGTPYWVASTVEYKIGLWSGKNIGGAVLLNAQTGESEYYDLEEIPTWVDQVFDSELVIDQLDYNGKYRSGFWNSIFGQKGVLQPTDGYNYLAINDDVYLYTGMTSVTSDESNVGFVLVNLRTKETKFYSIPGAEEYSAMSSAEGQVQHLSYNSTFPLLLNISDRPTYFMSLKDAAGLVKMYAFVDVQQYQIVGTGDTVDEARADYISKLKKEDVKVEDITETDVEGNIAAINSAVLEGNTHYFILLENDEKVYTVPVTLSDMLPFAEIGNSVKMTVASDMTVKEIEIQIEPKTEKETEKALD